jgi:hypothetical protein
MNGHVIVTGAAHGIGAAVARQLAEDGWLVGAIDRDAAGLDPLRTLASVHCVAADVGEEVQLLAALADCRNAQGAITALVPVAGINANGALAQTALEAWNRVLAVNLTATMLMAREAEADLRASRGAIVTIASTRAHMSETDTLAYSASKGGLVALTHALAMTLAPDVRVNCVSPGWIDTGKWGPLKPGDHAQHPVGRVGVPSDIAGAVSYLLSDKAGFITGAELIVDGGMTRKMIYV